MILRPRRAAGFTLIELMAAVVVMAILTAIAYPSYQTYVMRARRAAGKNLLMDVAARQEQFFANNKQYANTLVSLGFPLNPIEIDDNGQQVAAGATAAVYRITVARPTLVTYVISAVPLNGQTVDTKCATFTLTDTGVKGVTGSSTVADCW